MSELGQSLVVTSQGQYRTAWDEGDAMGTFKCRLGVSNGNGSQIEWVDALVDTGASFTMLPTSLLRRIGVPTGKNRRRFSIADGRAREFRITEARLHIGEDDYTNVVIEGPENRYLLGATSLQTFGLIADTTNHRLVPDSELTI